MPYWHLSEVSGKPGEFQVADDLSALGVRREDVFISLVEVPRENWSFGNGEMQYQPAP